MDRGVHEGEDSSSARPGMGFVLSGAGRITLIYAVVATAWITFSDQLVEGSTWSLTDPNTLKGLLFVAVTSLLLYGLVNRLETAMTRAADRQRDVERALLASEERYRTAFVGSPDAMAITDLADGRYIDVNQSFSRVSGWSREEVLGKTSLEIGIWDNPADRHKILQAVQGGERCDNFETRFRTRDGIVFDAVVTAHTLNLGGRTCVLTVTRDVTNRKRAEQELRKLSMAVEQSPESIVITNLAGEIEYVNQAFLRTTGYAWDEVIGRNPRVLQSGKTPQAAYDEMWHALLKERPWKGEFVNRRKDGSEYVEFAIVAPIRQVGGKVTHYLAIKDDITEKKRLGQELTAHREHLEDLVVQRTSELAEARRLAEAASVAKSEFLANMSHEIRTPMNAILGFAELLGTTALSPEQASHVRYIGDAGRHLLSIINDILDLSKIEAGKLTLERAPFELAAVFQEARVLIAEQAAAKGLAVTVDLGSAPPWLVGDPTRVRQALLNFAGNAVKFTRQGSIGLSAALLESRGDRALVRFEVRDTGIGIAADKLGLLFQPFQQVDVSTTRKHGGTGLGLAITRRLANLMGGDAGAESVEGQGSTFWFTAWLGVGSAPGTAAESPRPTTTADRLRLSHGGARVLLAEDEPTNQQVVQAMLAGTGLALDIAEDGARAVEMAAQRYDAILMDLRMPQMDGIEATRAIRSTPAGKDVPIIAITANVFEEDRRRCAEAGMNDFLAKPIERERLLSVLLACLSRRG